MSRQFRSSIDVLLAAKIHPSFVGYLCILKTAAYEGRTTDLQPDFKDFFDTYFAVSGGPPRKPYLRPFWNENSTQKKMWNQPNVAGSFSPQSARRILPFMTAVSISGSGTSGRYSLKPRHWEHAKSNLTDGMRVFTVPLTLFLYRDYAFEMDREAGLQPLIETFRQEFGFTDANDPTWNVSYSHLFQ